VPFDALLLSCYINALTSLAICFAGLPELFIDPPVYVSCFFFFPRSLAKKHIASSFFLIWTGLSALLPSQPSLRQRDGFFRLHRSPSFPVLSFLFPKAVQVNRRLALDVVSREGYYFGDMPFLSSAMRRHRDYDLIAYT